MYDIKSIFNVEKNRRIVVLLLFSQQQRDVHCPELSFYIILILRSAKSDVTTRIGIDEESIFIVFCFDMTNDKNVIFVDVITVHTAV